MSMPLLVVAGGVDVATHLLDSIAGLVTAFGSLAGLVTAVTAVVTLRRIRSGLPPPPPPPPPASPPPEPHDPPPAP